MKLKSLFIILLSTLTTISYSQKNKGVVINGVTWATHNVGASNPEECGDYFTWKEAKTACPKGWRLPTITELTSLSDTTKVINEYTTLNGINGRYFADKTTANKSIFMPADNEIYCTYWSSTRHNHYNAAYFFDFGNDGFLVHEGNKMYIHGRTARCIAKKRTPHKVVNNKENANKPTFTYEGHILLYQGQRFGMYRPNYLIIKTHINRYEHCSADGSISTFGSCDVKNDTLFLFPEYDYDFKTGLKSNITGIDSIPQIFLKKSNQLIEITDYKEYFKDIDAEFTGSGDYYNHYRDVFTLIEPNNKNIKK